MSWYSLEKRQAYLQDQSRRQPLPPFEPNQRLDDPALYQPSPELADAINVALRLGLPLLLTGEPGCGKTQLADHIAWFFNLSDTLVFNAQTTSSATDLFYQYDALGHFQYSQNNSEPLSDEELEHRFIRYRALGEAIRSKRRCVVLIDEIDKAPRDLPNDVLDAMDKLRFYVPEIDTWYDTTPENRPVIILTSNSEKNLPDAFLRRVVYFHIDFPKPDKMLEIVGAKIHDLDAAQLKPLIDYFYGIREDRSLKLKKAPATAELLQWAAYLRDAAFPITKLNNPDRLNDAERHLLQTSFSILAKTREDLGELRKRLE
ncbi:MAG: MoxR family ATPase [Saprospiraceae bacterium]|jgi:MoxR-like ATPase|nr:MoxR family ATPase [Saprospiraceae bacterium]